MMGMLINPQLFLLLMVERKDSKGKHVQSSRKSPRVLNARCRYFHRKNTFPLCTIANTPRLPEHCIEWAATLQWPEVYPKDKLDGDNPEHVTWVFEKSLGRAKEHNIPGVTYRLTQGVIKNIIPAIASTNAVIAAACANEAFKIATSCSQYLNNYLMYMGGNGVYTFTFEYEKNPDCLVCGSPVFKFPIQPTTTLEQLIETLMADVRIQLKTPNLTHEGKPLYMQAPPVLLDATRPNLAKPVSQLVPSGSQIIITDRLKIKSFFKRLNF